MSELYDDEILLWSERQGDLLRQIAAGEPVNGPNSLSVSAWQSDALLFRAQARRAFSPSMRQRLDLPSLYADALHAKPDTMDGQPPQPVSPTCPVTLDELLG
ncbi:MAG TPA: hypothetical protein VGI78_26365 [Acetobacteraceae bacterium]